MGLVKCPRCELNYMNDTDKMCSICRREVRGESEQFDIIELCSECGENPAVPGQELCVMCLKELARHAAVSTDDVIEPETASIEIDSVATMDEIELDLDNELDEELDDEVFDDEDVNFIEEDDEDLDDGEE